VACPRDNADNCGQLVAVCHLAPMQLPDMLLGVGLAVQEDARLLELVEEHGPRGWTQIAQSIGGRCVGLDRGCGWVEQQNSWCSSCSAAIAQCLHEHVQASCLH
jgi:hypothetical protein